MLHTYVHFCKVHFNVAHVSSWKYIFLQDLKKEIPLKKISSAYSCSRKIDVTYAAQPNL